MIFSLVRLARLFASICVLLAGLGAVPARADPADPYCVLGGSALAPISFGTVNVPRDATVGATLASMNATLTWTCPPRTTPSSSGDGYVIVIQRRDGVPDANNGIYASTGISGVALRIIAEGGDLPGNGLHLTGSVITSSAGAFLVIPHSSSTISGSTTINFQLRKSAAVTGSGPMFVSNPLEFLTEIAEPYNQRGATSPIGSVSGTLVIPTCSTSNVSLTLPTLSPADFPALGSLAGSTPFTISLNCPSGNPVRVRMTLTDNTDPANRTTNLTLAPASTATGIAIRIRSGTTARSFGPDSPVAGNPGQFAVGTMTAAGGIMNLALNASYVRTGTVTGGTVRAIATFTMSYQ